MGLPDLARAMQNGFVYCGQYAPARRRRHGNSCEGLSASRFVVFAQNHDQIGNRAVGDRLSAHLSVGMLKVMMAAVLLSPNVPLLFMGEEYGDQTPFQYFIEHGDPTLIEAVRRGRREEFAQFGWNAADIPDPQDVATFDRSRLRWEHREEASHAGLLRWTQELIAARKRESLAKPAAEDPGWPRVWTFEDKGLLVLHRAAATQSSRQLLMVLSFNPAPVALQLMELEGSWTRQLDAASPEFGGPVEQSLPMHFQSGPQASLLSLPPCAAGLFAC
jgi:maltooligosyltrehalose trehalohydrolase